jgi:hypothetical protein
MEKPFPQVKQSSEMLMRTGSKRFTMNWVQSLRLPCSQAV